MLADTIRRLEHDAPTIENVARANLGLIKPGEILVVVKRSPTPARPADATKTDARRKTVATKTEVTKTAVTRADTTEEARDPRE